MFQSFPNGCSQKRKICFHSLTTSTGPSSDVPAAQPGERGGSRQLCLQSTAVGQCLSPSSGHGGGESQGGLSESQRLHLLAGSWTTQVLAQPAQLFTAAWPIQLCVGEECWRQYIFLCCCQLPETLTILLYPEGMCAVRHFDGVLSNRCFCSQREGQIHNASHRCNIQPLCNSVPFGVLHR